MENVIIYTRVSTSKQVIEGQSLDAQEDALIEHARYKKMNVVKIFRDEGLSGKNKDREDLQGMLEFVKNNDIDKLLVFKLSRLSRKVSDLLSIIEELEEYGVSVVFVNDSIDTSTNTGKMITTILGSVAEMERENILEFSRLGMLKNAKEGKSNGGKTIGYKSIEKKIVVDEEYRKVIEQIFKLYTEDFYGFKKISKILNAQNIKTVRGVDFRPATVSSILRNDMYIGVATWTDTKNGKVYKTENSHEAIISKSLWEKAQLLLDTNSNSTKVGFESYLLTGVLKCPQCGKSMVGSKQGKYRYYKCSTNVNEGKAACNTNLVSVDRIEKSVLKELTKIIDNQNLLKKVIKKINSKNNVKSKPILENIEELEKKLENIKNEKTEIYDKKINGDIDFKELNGYLNHLQKKEKGIREEVQEVKETLKEVKSNIDESVIINKFNKIKNINKLDRINQKRIIRALIDTVEVNNASLPRGRTLKKINFFYEGRNDSVYRTKSTFIISYRIKDYKRDIKR